MQNIIKRGTTTIKPKENKLFYIAHPYSGNIEENMASVIEKTNELLDRGFKIICPLTHSHWLDLAKKRDPDFWYDLDIAIMEKCDGLILSPGWQESRGCILEYGYFMGQKKPVYLYEELIKP